MGLNINLLNQQTSAAEPIAFNIWTNYFSPQWVMYFPC